MANVLSIIPFLRSVLLGACLLAAVGCYEMDEVFAPAEPGDEWSADDGDAEDGSESDAATASDDAAPGHDGPGASDDAGALDGAGDDAAGGEFVCAFGEDTAELNELDHLGREDFDHFFGIDALTDFQLDQLLLGIGVFDFLDVDADLDALFAEIDDGRVLVRKIELLTTGQGFTHLRFHSRDFEYGFLFAQGSLRVVGAVDGGDILGCTVGL